MSNTWQAIAAEQESIYSIIRSKQKDVSEKGLEINKPWRNRCGAFSLALVPPASIRQAFSSLSQGIAKTVSAVVYEQQHVHVTLVRRLPFVEPFMYEPDGEHENILQALTRAAASAVSQFKRDRCEIHFDEYLYSVSDVIAAGYGNEGFFNLVSLLVAACAEEGVEAKPAWGAHSTISRFTEPRSSHQVGNLLDLLHRTRGEGLINVSQLAVGYSLWGKSPEFPLVEPADLDGHFTIRRLFNLGV